MTSNPFKRLLAKPWTACRFRFAICTTWRLPPSPPVGPVLHYRGWLLI